MLWVHPLEEFGLSKCTVRQSRKLKAWNSAHSWLKDKTCSRYWGKWLDFGSPTRPVRYLHVLLHWSNFTKMLNWRADVPLISIYIMGVWTTDVMWYISDIKWWNCHSGDNWYKVYCNVAWQRDLNVSFVSDLSHGYRNVSLHEKQVVTAVHIYLTQIYILTN